jgi:hypothetical protein
MRKFLLLVAFLLLVQPVQAADVGVNATASAGCGDGSCNYAENCANCIQDCGSCPLAAGSGSGVIGVGWNSTLSNVTGTTGAVPLAEEEAVPSPPAEQPTGASIPQGETTSTVPVAQGQQPGIPLGAEAIVLAGLVVLTAFIAFRHALGKKVIKHHLARNRW